jgi:uncharacterized protein (TIGR02266 family)
VSQNMRSSPRIATKIEITFKEPGSLIRAYMLNVSNGGIFVKTDKPIKLDSVVSLIIGLPGDPEKMEIQGRVVWSNPTGDKSSFPKGMGLQFVNLNSENREKIGDFVDTHSNEIQNNSII